MNMDNLIITYGLTAVQQEFLQPAVPVGYGVYAAECVTDLIVTDAMCCILDVAALSEDSVRTLLAYYMDVGDRLDETVVWLGDADLPELLSFVRCDSFSELLTELENILSRAKDRYDTMQMYTSEYGYLPRHAIAESLEADVYAALYRKYGGNLDVDTVRLVRRHWQAVLEAGAAEELAAVYELTRWLKGQGYHFEIKCATPFPFILELLNITGANPRYEASEADYTFVLPRCLETQIKQWHEHHWLNKSENFNHKKMIIFKYID